MLEKQTLNVRFATQVSKTKITYDITSTLFMKRIFHVLCVTKDFLEVVNFKNTYDLIMTRFEIFNAHYANGSLGARIH